VTGVQTCALPIYRVQVTHRAGHDNFVHAGPVLPEAVDRAAQFRLGVMYEQGKSVPQDYTEAANWYRRSADQGYGQGQNNLGNL